MVCKAGINLSAMRKRGDAFGLLGLECEDHAARMVARYSVEGSTAATYHRLAESN